MLTPRIDNFPNRNHEGQRKVASSPQVEAAVLDLVRNAAKAGLRCPQNFEIVNAVQRAGYGMVASAMLPNLARKGRLRVEIYAGNWRVAEIDGLRTQGPPAGSGVPYKVIDGAGS